MPSTTISVFFAGKKLQIPGYQRDYAWTRENVNDLFSDIEEAIQLGGSHYLGTFILARESLANSLYEVVDGQQRLTTLTMLLDVLIKKISDSETNVFYVNSFIRDPLVGQKFSLLGENSSFFFGSVG